MREKVKTKDRMEWKRSAEKRRNGMKKRKIGGKKGCQVYKE